MHLIVDGAVYQWQRHGGISRLFREILPRVCDMDQSLRVSLYTGGRCDTQLPAHARIDACSPRRTYGWLGPGRVRSRIDRGLAAVSARIAERPRRNAIWHSTYYTRPRHLRAPEIVTVVDMIHERFPAVFAGPDHDRFRARKRECILNAEAIICISNATRDDLFAFCPPVTRNVHVIPLAHSASFRMLDELPAGLPACKPFVLYVGDRAGAHKNFSLLRDAFAQWRCRHDVDLVVAGRGWTDVERRDLERSGLADHVRVITEPDDDALARLYNDALALIYPSLYEGFGIPLLEAMACGCPIVASRIPSTIEVAGDSAVYFEADDRQSLIAALDVGLGARDDLQRTNAGRARAGHYSWDKTAAKTLAVYRAVAHAG